MVPAAPPWPRLIDGLGQVTWHDVATLTATIYGEARGNGEPQEGRVAVAHTILNRVRARTWYGTTIEDVCLKAWQFSCWNGGGLNSVPAKYKDPNADRCAALRGLLLEGRMMEMGRHARDCYHAALEALNGGTDPTGGATHYYNPKVAAPKWAESPLMEYKTTIGSHKFFWEGQA